MAFLFCPFPKNVDLKEMFVIPKDIFDVFLDFKDICKRRGF